MVMYPQSLTSTTLVAVKVLVAGVVLLKNALPPSTLFSLLLIPPKLVVNSGGRSETLTRDSRGGLCIGVAVGAPPSPSAPSKPLMPPLPPPPPLLAPNGLTRSSPSATRSSSSLSTNALSRSATEITADATTASAASFGGKCAM